MSDRRNEISQNLEYFLRELPTLLASHHGKFALMRDRKIIGIYETAMDAVSAANLMYPDKIFSVQQITDVAADAGFFSHAMPLGTP